MVFVVFAGAFLFVGFFFAGVWGPKAPDRNQTPGSRAGPNFGYGPDYTGPLPALRLEGDSAGTYAGEKALPLPTAEDRSDDERLIPSADDPQTSLGLRQRPGKETCSDVAT